MCVCVESQILTRTDTRVRVAVIFFAGAVLFAHTQNAPSLDSGLPLLPQPLPRLHQRPPEQIQPPPGPLRRRPHGAEAHAPHAIPRARLHELPLARAQQHCRVALELPVVALLDDARARLAPRCLVEAGHGAPEGFLRARVGGAQDLGCGRRVVEENGFAVHHVSGRGGAP